MGQACSRRRSIVTVGNIVVQNRWLRLASRYLEVIRNVAIAQRIFPAANIFLGAQPRSLLHNSTRARGLGLL